MFARFSRFEQFGEDPHGHAAVRVLAGRHVLGVGHVDAVVLVRLDPSTVGEPGLDAPSVGLDVLVGVEDPGRIVGHDLEDGRRMHDHVVDRITGGGVAASTGGSGGRIQRDGGREPTGRNRDDAHIVVHLHVVVHILVAVHDHAGDATLQEPVRSGVHEQDAALIRHFGIVQGRGGQIDGGHGSSTGGKGFGDHVGRGSTTGILCKSVICFQRRSLIFARPIADRTAAYFYADKTISSPALHGVYHFGSLDPTPFRDSR